MRLAKNLTVVLPVILLLGCMTGDLWTIQHSSFNGGTYLQRTSPEAIKIFRRGSANPVRSHIEIALISLRPKLLTSQIGDGGSIDATLHRVKTYAAKLGADGIKDVQIYVAPTGTVGHGLVSIDGVAIRWN